MTLNPIVVVRYAVTVVTGVAPPHRTYVSIAQSGEQPPFKRRVVGSIPSGDTCGCGITVRKLITLPCEGRNAGSIPANHPTSRRELIPNIVSGLLCDWFTLKIELKFVEW